MGKVKIPMMRVVRAANNPGPLSEDGFVLRSARFIGRTAWRIHQVIINKWFLTAVAVTTLYFLMHLAGISIEITKASHTLMIIR
ncbi:hypothetical protein EG830_12610 [bacterium]|nr:hypothetical protein [bacterium]